MPTIQAKLQKPARRNPMGVSLWITKWRIDFGIRSPAGNPKFKCPPILILKMFSTENPKKLQKKHIGAHISSKPPISPKSPPKEDWFAPLFLQ